MTPEAVRRMRRIYHLACGVGVFQIVGIAINCYLQLPIGAACIAFSMGYMVASVMAMMSYAR